MIDALKRHWPEYIIEGACLGLFMVSAFTFGTVLEHPASSIHHAIPNPLLRPFLMRLAMGGTAIAIIYSPWGKQSGAHINPSTTSAPSRPRLSGSSASLGRSVDLLYRAYDRYAVGGGGLFAHERVRSSGLRQAAS